MKNTKTNNAKRRIFLAIALITVILFGFIACEDDESDPIIDISLNKNTLNLIVGGKPETLKATIINEGSKDVIWSSSKPDVAKVDKVDNEGEVTAVKTGTTIITATMKDGGKTATCVVTVQEVYSTSTDSKEIEMISIPTGFFIMGQIGIAEPIHLVTLTEFYMGKYEVTQEQYEAVMTLVPTSNPTPSNFRAEVPGEDDTPDKLPVEKVSWYDALIFCNKLSMIEGFTPAYSIDGKTDPAVWGTIPSGSDPIWDAAIIVAGSNGYRLPTHSQWEYACRAGTTTAYNTGDIISDNTGWYKSNSGEKTHQVGLKSANAWGLYDMHGNVREWCWDWNEDNLTNPGSSSSGPVRVGRGGGYDDDARFLRSAFRYSYDPYIRNPSIGFRVVRPY